MNRPVNKPTLSEPKNRLRAVLSLLGSASIMSACFLVHQAHGGDVIGKVVTGYQGWLSAPGDGSSVNQWKHTNLECWPDVREYTTTFSGVPFQQAGVSQPGYTGNLGNGSPARIFSSWTDQTVNKHFEWMQYYGGIDCVALQRFGSELGNIPLKNWKNGIANKVRSAAETYGRKYYIMYDISGWTNFQSEIKSDWTALKDSHINSSAYAMEGGKPVICLWGMGFSGRPGNAQSWKDMLDWFKAQGCYVIGGLSQSFHTDSGSYTDPVTQVVTTNQEAYKVCDMVMVWTVGKSSGFSTLYSAGLSWCNANGKEYQADVYPGTAFYNTDFDTDPTAVKNKRPRMHGDFMWSQFAAVRSTNVQSVYISMFDELQEATQIFKTAEDSSMVPDGKYFLTLDADGVACSSDFYLRLTKDGADMVKGVTPYVTEHPTQHIIGGNLVLNPSFEAGGVSPTSWARGGSAVGSTVSAQDGSNSLRIATAGANAPTKQTIPIQIGKTYNLSVWINASGRTSGNVVFDTSDQYDGLGQGQFVLSSANSGWTKYSGSFTATTSSVTLRMFTEATFGGTVYFDNIVLQKVNDVPVATPLSVTTAEDTARSILLSGSDFDYDTLTYAIVTQPTNGTLSGTAPNLIYTPAANFTGTDAFDFTVNDGIVSSAGATVTITVTPIDDLPTITDITDKSTNENTATPAIAFTVGDVETAVNSLVITSSSSNTSLVPLTHVVLGGSGANRTVTVTPAANQSGTSTITLTVSDGTLTASDTFVLTVIPNGPVNLVLNPSFEIGGAAPTSWTRGGSAVGSMVSAQDGVNSLRIATAGTNNPTTQAIPIQVGTTYNLSVWINASGMTSGIAVFDTNDKYDGIGQGQFVMNTANAGWTKYSGSFTATTTSINLRMFTGSTFAGTVYFDSITLTEVPVPPFSSWINGFYQGSSNPEITGFKADPDDDGMANGLEFVLGGNPAINDAASIMPTGAKAGGNYAFTYKRNDASESGTLQVVQYANNLGVWTDVTIASASGSSGGASYTVNEGTPATHPDTVVVTIPHGGADRLFVRLKVVQQ